MSLWRGSYHRTDLQHYETRAAAWPRRSAAISIVTVRGIWRAVAVLPSCGARSGLLLLMVGQLFTIVIKYKEANGRR